MTKVAITEKGDAKKLLEWFKAHKDDEYATLLEKTVKESRDKLNLG